MGKRPFTCANGQNSFVCKKWCYFIFQDFFHSVKINHENRCYDIYLKDKVVDIEGKEEDLKEEFGEWIEYFKSFWGNQFNLIILKQEKL